MPQVKTHCHNLEELICLNFVFLFITLAALLMKKKSVKLIRPNQLKFVWLYCDLIVLDLQFEGKVKLCMSVFHKALYHFKL